LIHFYKRALIYYAAHVKIQKFLLTLMQI